MAGHTGEQHQRERQESAPRLMRSFLFLPAHNTKFIDKALESEADAIILDMEDAVPPARREEARGIVRQYSESGKLERKTVYIRINHLGTEDFVRDFSELILPGVDGLMPSKIETAEDLVFIDRLLEFFEIKNGLPAGSVRLAPLIETTAAIANICEIAKASPRLTALCLGGEDYLNDLGTIYVYQQTALAWPRAVLANAARMNGLLPIDTPYLNIPDVSGFEENEKLAYKNGFAGCLLINPRQIAPANRAFSPDEEQIDHAGRVIGAIQKAAGEGTSGVAMLNGTMVGPPMRKRAENVMVQAGLTAKRK
ncbi:MAG: CoA ester lyase [Eubacteriales bacterium]|nr:CoA ester lyase [Eubacteriales bacterium]